ncbi:hypothetical protein AAFA46_04745 [Oscillospiraceae bacterium WX1]
MSFQYYALPQNTSGAALIPISNAPTPLAFLTVVTDDANNLVTLRANIGWRAALSTTRIIYKIWRTAPGTGTLVCSVQDGAENFNDYAATTDFSDVVSVTPNQPVTFILTAETVDVGAQASVVGPLSFTAFGTNLTVISYYELINNTVGGANIPIAQAPVPLAYFTVNVQAGQTVILRPSVCWNITGSSLPKVDVLFKLWRGAPVTGTLVCSADDSADVERAAVTSFSHVDSGFTAAQTVTYVLTAEAPDINHAANITGALTVTASVQTIGAYAVLPQNTSGSVSIPLTTAGTPLASLTLPISAGMLVSLRAAAGLAFSSGTSSGTVPVLYKIWRGAPNTGILIYSTLDSGETGFDKFKVTALGTIDSGFTSTGQVTYTLTAELVNASAAASIIGPLTFTAVPEN